METFNNEISKAIMVINIRRHLWICLLEHNTRIVGTYAYWQWAVHLARHAHRGVNWTTLALFIFSTIPYPHTPSCLVIIHDLYTAYTQQVCGRTHKCHMFTTQHPVNEKRKLNTSLKLIPDPWKQSMLNNTAGIEWDIFSSVLTQIHGEKLSYGNVPSCTTNTN